MQLKRPLWSNCLPNAEENSAMGRHRAGQKPCAVPEVARGGTFASSPTARAEKLGPQLSVRAAPQIIKKGKGRDVSKGGDWMRETRAAEDRAPEELRVRLRGNSGEPGHENVS